MTTISKSYARDVLREINLRRAPLPNEERMIIGQIYYSSGEISYTYYLSRYDPPHHEFGAWAFWKFGDWKGDQPENITFGEIHKVGLSEDYRIAHDMWTAATQEEAGQPDQAGQ